MPHFEIPMPEPTPVEAMFTFDVAYWLYPSESASDAAQGIASWILELDGVTAVGGDAEPIATHPAPETTGDTSTPDPLETLIDLFLAYAVDHATVNIVVSTGYGTINGTVEQVGADYVTVHNPTHGAMHVALAHIVNVWEVTE